MNRAPNIYGTFSIGDAKERLNPDEFRANIVNLNLILSMLRCHNDLFSFS
jgi:hypothetical protein